MTLNARCRQAEGAEIDRPRTSMATGSARCGTQCPSRVKLRSTDLASGLPFNLQQRKRLRQAGAAGECQLPTSGEPPLTTAIEPSRSSSLSDGLMPHCRHCLAPLAGPQWVEAAIHFGLDWPRCPDRNLCSRGGSDGYARNRLSIKRLEQRLRFFENWRTETLGEPAIDRRQQLMRFGVLALSRHVRARLVATRSSQSLALCCCAIAIASW